MPSRIQHKRRVLRREPVLGKPQMGRRCRVCLALLCNRHEALEDFEAMSGYRVTFGGVEISAIHFSQKSKKRPHGEIVTPW
jgi:hypothetical protein